MSEGVFIKSLAVGRSPRVPCVGSAFQSTSHNETEARLVGSF